MQSGESMTNAAPAGVKSGTAAYAGGRAYAQINPDEYRVVKSGVDSFLLFTVLSLLVFGLVMVFSARFRFICRPPSKINSRNMQSRMQAE